MNVNGVQITAVPADHEGSRTLRDGKSHLKSFTGYLIRYHGLAVYFPGDTAFRPEFFSEVNQRYGPVDLALLPIGPITPEEVMQKTHMNPAQAVRAANIVQAKIMLPVHFETFVNSLDKPDQDRAALVAAEAAIPHPSTSIVNWHIGQSVVIR